MKILFVATAGLLISAVSIGQNSAPVGQESKSFFSIPYTGVPLPATYLSNIIQPLKIFDKLNVAGSPYLSDELKPGFARIKNGYVQNDVLLRFNIYSNEIEFQLNNTAVSVLDSMDFAIYFDLPGDSSSIRFFKTGYPETAGNKETTIYEVLAMGVKAHLIKYSTQKIEDKRVMGTGNARELVTYSTLYLFDTEKKSLEKVKNPKEQLALIFPKSSQAIEQIIKARKLNVKKEEHLGELVSNLNKMTD